jgi:hypothetical protein
MKGTFRIEGNTLIATGEAAVEALRAFPNGKVVTCDVRGGRNPEQLNLFWALCTLVAEADDDAKENVKRWVLRELGYIDIWYDRRSARTNIETKSIAFENMPQAVFNEFFRKAVEKLSERLGTTKKEFLDEYRARFENMIADKRYDEILRGRK